MSRVTLVQWQMLAAVVDHGGFARAAVAVHKSASTLHHAVHKLESQLGVILFEPVGRQVRLTEAGEMLLRRARQLIENAEALEAVAESVAGGLESEVSLAVDQIFPVDVLARAMEGFSEEYPFVRVKLYETVLNGGVEILQDGRADLVISSIAARGFLGEPLITLRFMAVAHPKHPLHLLGRPLDLRDLGQHRQLVVRDSARHKSTDAGWLEAEQRWTVSHLSTSQDMLERGLGFAWFPEIRLREAFESGRLKPLPLGDVGSRLVPMQLIFKDRDGAGPAIKSVARWLKEAVLSLKPFDYRD
jgi:DNA-binding transcriptional LysR family regulator